MTGSASLMNGTLRFWSKMKRREVRRATSTSWCPARLRPEVLRVGGARHGPGESRRNRAGLVLRPRTAGDQRHGAPRQHRGASAGARHPRANDVRRVELDVPAHAARARVASHDAVHGRCCLHARRHANHRPALRPRAHHRAANRKQVSSTKKTAGRVSSRARGNNRRKAA